ncbi:MoxR family ATPase [Candidatus Gracilibacteria bacterium]|nr:MoxR family ATPase [Candidatus Gracilibacteria bacterium]
MNEKIKSYQEKIISAKNEIAKKIIGQEELIESLFLSIFSGGHILLEGVPGLAKTESIKAISEIFGASFKRVSFTPDLLPSDVLGGMIFDQKKSEFKIKKGPIFTNFLLGDEINRAPAKVQSSLLEAMAEKQVTIGDETFALPKPFLVMATQNPLEQEGTFPLPEAQVDRFFMKVILGYPSEKEEFEIVQKNLNFEKGDLQQIFSLEEISEIQKICENIYLDENLISYITKIISATRKISEIYPEFKDFIEYGCSPRASISLAKAVQAMAFFEGKDFANPDDVKKVAKRILRHRIGLTYRAEIEGVDADFVIEKILEKVELV